jgi:AhpD family alkylhydroperoxidase
MSNRINIKKIEPGAYKALLVLEDYIDTTSLSPLQKEMIRIRASQLNGCAYCIDTHTREARNAGELEHRLYTLSVWREAPFFTAEEKAILALTEEVTLISNGVSNETYLQAVEILGEQKTAQVIMNAIVINAWNRVGVSTRMVPEGKSLEVSYN